ncbi:MAG: ATP-dependent RecD-like DNA helicase [Lachnospiraceae bacterium]|nr:ATP-dependent RecD-like DNA helicase [Lachnospiraceae bacterium]
MSQDTYIEGYVEHIIYRNAENGYSVLQLVLNDGEEEKVVGKFPFISEGEYLSAKGEYIDNKNHGIQFQVESYEIKIPDDTKSMERYLGSGAIKGIGPKLAAKIVKKFKMDTFRIIEEEGERLSEIVGISEKKAREIVVQFQEKQGMRQAMMFLAEYGVANQLAVKIYEEYGPQLYEVIRENPYRLAEDISGVGFHTADEIAKRSGIQLLSNHRIRAGILYILQDEVANGNVYYPLSKLKERGISLLQVDGELLEKNIMDLAIDRKVVLKELGEEEAVYLAKLYYLELKVANKLCELNVSFKVKEEEEEAAFLSIESEKKMVLDEKQEEAIRAAARHGVTIVTGGPGTGKTTTINSMIRYFEKTGQKLLLAAPTGRAAKRMSEATGRDASTIHRLLEVNGEIEEKGHSRFERNEENPLEADVVIIDEMSMVDIFLMDSLLAALVQGCRLILVGDVNQLPSVGAGNVLKDMIASKEFAVVKLTKIFRQTNQSNIVINAHKINAGEVIELSNQYTDFCFLEKRQVTDIAGIVVHLVKEVLPKHFKISPMEVQVLAPMKKGELGVEYLNKVLQSNLNPPDDMKAEREVRDTVFRTGDKVMQIKNNYKLEWEIRNEKGFQVEKGIGAFNGDVGVIRDISYFSEEVIVEFDDKRVARYPFSSLDELELAYAITIHKSQGSEYPVVVMPILQGPPVLFNRNLLYTAVTRAKQSVSIIGSKSKVLDMIRNVRELKRYTSLTQRIIESKQEQMW